MSDLHAFLHPVQGDETKEIIISKRFRDAEGNPVPFKIRALTQEENEKLSRQSRRSAKKGAKEFDEIAYTRRIIVAATVEPDFSSEELCKAYGVMDPQDVPGKMLLAGEYSRLGREIMDLSGFTNSGLEERAKN